MTIDAMRAAISGVYSSPGWQKKTADMPEDRVIAIYYSFLSRGLFDRPKRQELRIPTKSIKHEPEKSESTPEFEQLTIPGFF